MNPPLRIRRDPRDPASLRARVPGTSPAVATPAPRLVTVEDSACTVMAVVDLDAGRLSRDDRDLMGAARQLADALAGAVVLVACLPPAVAFRAQPDQEGADRTMLLRDAGYADDLAEPRVSAVVAAANACAARHILFSDSFVGGELARRVAARLGDRPACNVRRLSADGLQAEIDAGRIEVNRPLPRVIVTARASFEPIEPTPLREARPLPVIAAATAPRVRGLGLLPLDPAAVPLGEAALIISAGSGLTDWHSFHEAARALGAAEGGSRVVCDAGLLPRSRQVGASGLLVEPRCYLAFGIAGASQHLQGIAGAERVIAVNTDLRADMVKRADLAIVADAQAVLPALVRRAAARRQECSADAQRVTGGAAQAATQVAGEHPAADIHPAAGADERQGLRSGSAPTVEPGKTGQAAVVALVSLGRHPVSKRARRADLDARALELALCCSASATVLHAGPAGEGMTTLREYVGAGAASLVVLDCAMDADPLPALEADLRARKPGLIVAGARAEVGECSGMTPFWLAERLGCGLACNIVAVELQGETARLVQALPGGRRRRLEAALPLVITVDRTGPEPRLSARMRALRGVPDVRPGSPAPLDDRPHRSVKPSRQRPKRLAAPKALGQGGALDADQRREMIGPDPDVAADAILDFLEREGLLAPAMPKALEAAT